MFFGDNGTGKTIFMSYILIQAIKKRYTTYYTTMPQLDHDLKRGFNDRQAAKRLDWMLSSDFMAIDELGKEKYRDGDSWIRGQIERILKQRFDNSLCTVIGTNSNPRSITKAYGESISSILLGKYKVCNMEVGDFREKMAAKMETEIYD
jgi:DNA replication protein DnaC